MRAAILAAGRGERLGELTRETPKPMLEVMGRPVLEHNIEWLRSNGVTEIYINLHHLPERITSYFGDGRRFGVNIRYSREEKLLGTAGGVGLIARRFWEKPERFVVVYGDNVFECSLGEVMETHVRNEAVATIALYEREDLAQSGVVRLDASSRVVAFIEKPGARSDLAGLVNMGLYVLEPAVLEGIPQEGASDFGRDIFPAMAGRNERLFGVKVAGRGLRPIDTPELLNLARDGRARDGGHLRDRREKQA